MKTYKVHEGTSHKTITMIFACCTLVYARPLFLRTFLAQARCHLCVVQIRTDVAAIRAEPTDEAYLEAWTADLLAEFEKMMGRKMRERVCKHFAIKVQPDQAA
jgi:hypothetical protein